MIVKNANLNKQEPRILYEPPHYQLYSFDLEADAMRPSSTGNTGTPDDPFSTPSQSGFFSK